MNISFHGPVGRDLKQGCIFDGRSINKSAHGAQELEIEEIILEGESQGTQRQSFSSESSREGKSWGETIKGISKARCIYWVNIVLLLSFTSLCIAIGSVDAPEAKEGLKIGEQVCQGIFLLLLILKLINQEQHEKMWLAIDLMTVAATFLGSYLQNEEVGRCFQALRTLRIAFLIKEV